MIKAQITKKTRHEAPAPNKLFTRNDNEGVGTHESAHGLPTLLTVSGTHLALAAALDMMVAGTTKDNRAAMTTTQLIWRLQSTPTSTHPKTRLACTPCLDDIASNNVTSCVSCLCICCIFCSQKKIVKIQKLQSAKKRRLTTAITAATVNNDDHQKPAVVVRH